MSPNEINFFANILSNPRPVVCAYIITIHMVYPVAHSFNVPFEFLGYQWCEKSLHKLLSKDKHLEQLTEEGAIDLGAAIWAEIVVFIGCSKFVLVETNK